MKNILLFAVCAVLFLCEIKCSLNRPNWFPLFYNLSMVAILSMCAVSQSFKVTWDPSTEAPKHVKKKKKKDWKKLIKIENNNPRTSQKRVFTHSYILNTRAKSIHLRNTKWITRLHSLGSRIVRSILRIQHNTYLACGAVLKFGHTCFTKTITDNGKFIYLVI